MPLSPEVSFQKVRALLELGEFAAASEALRVQAETEGQAWRDWWWEAVVQLAEGDAARAVERFQGLVVPTVPGQEDADVVVGQRVGVGADSFNVLVPGLVKTPAGRPPKSVPKSRDAARTSARATLFRRLCRLQTCYFVAAIIARRVSSMRVCQPGPLVS